MNIDFANLKVAYQRHQVQFDKAIKNSLKSANYIMGPEIEELERKLSKFTGAKHSISCASGTDALLLALMALDIQPGDEIITTPFTFIATAETIALIGATPVFVDISAETYNIDVNLIEGKITENTKAILPVSLFGQIADMDEINAIAKKHNLSVIEDGAQSFGATYKNKKSGNLSTIACTSFFPAKPLGCFGDGGAVFTSDSMLAEKLKSLRVHGQTERYRHNRIGLCSRLDNLQAAVLLVKLNHYEEDINKRQSAAKRYNKLLKNILPTPIVKEYNSSVWAQYSIRIKSRKFIRDKLNSKDIPTATHYPIPLHLQECFKYLAYKEGDFPISESVSREIISLPINPYISYEEQIYICEEIKKLL